MSFDPEKIIYSLFGLVMAGMGLFLKHLYEKTESHNERFSKTASKDDVKDVVKNLDEFKAHVAENYAHNGQINEIKQIATNTNNRVDQIYHILIENNKK